MNTLQTQRCLNTQGNVYATEKVLLGPIEWEVGGLKFFTVLVKTPDNLPGQLSVIETRTGGRVFKVGGIKAPKTRPHEALEIIKQTMTQLIEKVGEKRIAVTIRDRASLP